MALNKHVLNAGNTTTRPAGAPEERRYQQLPVVCCLLPVGQKRELMRPILSGPLSSPSSIARTENRICRRQIPTAN
jgi:hypothetical protein